MNFLTKAFNNVQATVKPVAIAGVGCAAVVGIGTAIVLTPLLAVPAAIVGAVGGGYIAYKNNKPQ